MTVPAKGVIITAQRRQTRLLFGQLSIALGAATAPVLSEKQPAPRVRIKVMKNKVKISKRPALFALTILVAALTVFTCACNLLSPGITLSQKSIELIVGDEFRLTASGSGTVTWSSSDESVATVEDGLVTAIAAGEATVSASRGNATASCAVTVVSEEDVPGDEGDTGEEETPGGEDTPGGEEETPGGEVTPPAEDEPWGERELVWADEFDGTSLDMQK